MKIATTADFNGSRWTTNAVIHQVPAGLSYLLPVGSVARLFKRNSGKEAVSVKSLPTDLDMAGSRTGNKIFLHVANMNYTHGIEARFSVNSMVVAAGRVLEIAPENPRQEVSPLNPDVFKPQEHPLAAVNPVKHTFPARSVSVVELDCLTG